MKEPLRLSDNEKWLAVVSCDSKYDSQFLYGVKTTMICCRPSCKSQVTILEIVCLAGFKSVSSFYKSFKNQTGYSPHGIARRV